ncbi:hypothetical protein NE237_007074 [Protea cynaroides]|uniref:Uncharacterized protein n=1 Tax=Protea cynaroides TaxID=273540 RepID=A0A9Q0QVS1_9MAGN|nr:hypothetical protein NE237_007074 [Protea cynaroides]
METENHHHHHEGEMERETGEEIADSIFTKRGCCFWIPCFGSDRSDAGGKSLVWWERIQSHDNDEQSWRNDNEKQWWRKGLKAVLKLREWSEIVAGPRWKTFIRRFNKKNNRGGGGSVAWKTGKFQYDPLSYALNFDEGQGQNGHSDEDVFFRDFSSRYASIPISVKSSMDLGKDGPSFT